MLYMWCDEIVASQSISKYLCIESIIFKTYLLLRKYSSQIEFTELNCTKGELVNRFIYNIVYIHTGEQL